MSILVTGGAGYIGTHTCVSLLNAGYSVIIADNLVDITNSEDVEKIFSSHKIEGVIHFAGLKAVGESVEKPLQYYYNNLVSTIVIAEACIKFGVEKLIFSSSATVYGDNVVPFTEEMELKPTTNPYGTSKAMCEKILIDVVNANPNFSVSLLRYFNPVGAHESGLIGEAPNGIPNNLMPYLTQVAKGKLEKLRVFGNDYPTIDGTGVRDYIHVMDLAEGHLAAFNHIKRGVQIYNLGTGNGVSVLQLIKAFEEANNMIIPYSIVERRAGDIAECYADVSKVEKELGWTAKKDVLEMCRDAWKFELNNI
ncbi:MAG: galE [Bacillales bacterium]|nr:galE [Bacillales bacterium]